MLSNVPEDITFVSMAQLLDESNAGIVGVDISGYHLMICKDEAYKVMMEAYNEWAELEE